jgi:hypothetical protein
MTEADHTPNLPPDEPEIPEDGPADFTTALAWMKADKSVKRAHWPDGKFLTHPGFANAKPGAPLDPFILTDGKESGPWHTTTPDLNAEDWMVA